MWVDRLGVMPLPDELIEVVRSVRPALKATYTTEEQRASFLYDLIQEVYLHVKFDVHSPEEESSERCRIGEISDVALPPVEQKAQQDMAW